MTQAVIFDFDGLILDTEVPDFQSWQEAYAAYGCTLDRAVWSACIGTSSGTLNPLTNLQLLLGRSLDHDAVRTRRKERFLELIEAEKPLPGVEAAMAAANRLGLRIGVASSSSEEWVAGHLARLGLLTRIDVMRCSDHVERVKPDPELYLSVLNYWGLRRDEAIALEDSPNGIRAARRAGLFCIAVPNGMTRDLPLDEANLRLGSLEDKSLEALLEEVNATRTKPLPQDDLPPALPCDEQPR